MSVTDDVLQADEAYARNFKLGDLAMTPARKLAILACMDARITSNSLRAQNGRGAHYPQRR